jgi:hypothetical protein
MDNNEINRKIAEEIMKVCWHEIKTTCAGDKFCDCGWLLSRESEFPACDISDHLRLNEKRYTENIADAFEVVEKLSPEYYFVILTAGNSVYVYKKGISQCVSNEYHGSLPLAICKAALKAKEGK